MEQENKPHHYGYGKEYVHHERENERHHSRNHHNRDGLDQSYKNQPIRYLRLIWDEKGVVLEYTLRFNNTRRGFWMSSSPQKGKNCLNPIKIHRKMNMCRFYIYISECNLLSVVQCLYLCP